MVAPLRLEADEVAHAAVARQFETTRDADERLRCQMVLLALDGHTASVIAPLVRRSSATVRRVLHRFRQEGRHGPAPRRSPGRPLVVTPDWQAELRRVIALSPRAVGVPSAIWTTGLLAAYLAEATGQRVGLETVRDHLHRAGYVCKRPTWTLKRKAEEQADWAGKG